MDWSDLRYALVVAREGTLAGAAKVLGVNHSTVLRRVKALEDSLGVRLFERHARGYVTTPAGDELVTLATEIERSAERLERRLGGHDMRLSGTVRVTAVDGLAHHIAPPLVEFRRKYPEIAVELDIGTEPRDISRGEADIALRVTTHAPESLVGRRLAEVAWAVYATPSYVAGRKGPLHADTVEWVVLTQSFGRNRFLADWEQAHVPPERVAARMGALLPAAAAIRAGLGIGLLPTGYADVAGDLVRLGEPVKFGASLWLLTHPDLKRVARVRVVMDWLNESLLPHAGAIEGRRPAQPPLAAVRDAA